MQVSHGLAPVRSNVRHHSVPGFIDSLDPRHFGTQSHQASEQPIII
jgi:hypothetical protein